MKCPTCQRAPQDVYEHPVYKERQRKLNWCEKQIFEDRNLINKMHNTIFNLELRIASLTRQLEDDNGKQL